jgi:hypothetical protein
MGVATHYHKYGEGIDSNGCSITPEMQMELALGIEVTGMYL